MSRFLLLPDICVLCAHNGNTTKYYPPDSWQHCSNPDVLCQFHCIGNIHSTDFTSIPQANILSISPQYIPYFSREGGSFRCRQKGPPLTILLGSQQLGIFTQWYHRHCNCPRYLRAKPQNACWSGDYNQVEKRCL